MVDGMVNRILIVDDNPKNLQLLGNILKDNSYKAEFATNGKQALEWIKDQEFDLVLLDIMMPGMDGYETCKRIRSNEGLNDMPVIFLTAKTDKESIINGFDSGAQDFISKPFDSRELLARVKTHLELRSSKLKIKAMNSGLERKVRERTEQLERANRQLKTLDQAKTDFLNLIGHELRTPLNGIIGPMELIKLDYDNPELEKMLNLITVSVERLEKFAYDALLVTNLQTGKYNISVEKVDIYEIFTILNTRLKRVLEKSNSKIDIVVPEGVYAIGDKELLITCFEKIIENTLLYIRESGTLIVDGEEENGIVTIKMSDRRIEFSESFLDGMDKLFEPDGEYTDSNLGIGMALVNQILSAHNGSLTMHNIKGIGASLILKIAQ